MGKVTRRPQAAKFPSKKRNRSIIAPSSAPVCALGHLPPRGKAYGRPRGAAPTAEDSLGTLARQTQAQTWNRTKNKFCKLRAQWPGGKLGTHSNFARRKRCTPSQECVPRNGVRGKRPMDLGGAKRSRSPSDASPGAFCLLCRHGQSRSPPAGGEIPQQETKPLYHRPLIRPSVRTGAPSPQGEGLRAADSRPYRKKRRRPQKKERNPRCSRERTAGIEFAKNGKEITPRPRLPLSG